MAWVRSYKIEMLSSCSVALCVTCHLSASFNIAIMKNEANINLAAALRFKKDQDNSVLIMF